MTCTLGKKLGSRQLTSSNKSYKLMDLHRKTLTAQILL
uniref:Uncharacterized protein n=1 Tax=Arundo donax TaxID=35708 RepID=A0A0A8YQG1_ARUDO